MLHQQLFAVCPVVVAHKRGLHVLVQKFIAPRFITLHTARVGRCAQQILADTHFACFKLTRTRVLTRNLLVGGFIIRFAAYGTFGRHVGLYFLVALCYYCAFE